MESLLKAMDLQLSFNGQFVCKFMEKVPDRSAFSVRSDTVNPPLWLIVHMAEARCFFGRQLGIRYKPSWGNLKLNGDDIYKLEKYPELGVLQSDWKTINEIWKNELNNISLDVLNKPFSRSFPINDGTKFGLFIFMVNHESFHMGQLGSWWKLLGDGSIVDFYPQIGSRPQEKT